jgi:glycosyltransferase involved in cell wall biosynthesis
MIDILVTTFNRVEFLRKTVESLYEKNREIDFRLLVIDDCSTDGTPEYLLSLRREKKADVYLNGERRGLAFSLDMVWRCMEQFDFFLLEHPYLCYLQDDIASEEDEWLLTVLKTYEDLKEKYPIGFFSGFHSPEHPVQNVVNCNGRNVFLKKSNSGKNMIAEKTFWQSVGYIPRLNPDGSERGMPGGGKGSHVDVYLEGCYSGSKFNRFSAAPNCSYNQGKQILVVPGLLKHLGQDNQYSTWQKDRK